MDRSNRGFTLIELMIAVVIIGILAAIAIPNFIAMEVRAKEGSLKANMHTFQLSAEDYGVHNDGAYAPLAVVVVSVMPGAGSKFVNPFDRSVGSGNAWCDQPSFSRTMLTGSTVRGIVAYADSANQAYCIAGQGHNGTLRLHLTNGS